MGRLPHSPLEENLKLPLILVEFRFAFSTNQTRDRFGKSIMATVTFDTLAAIHRLRDAQNQLVTQEYLDAKIGLVEARINLLQ